MIRRRVVAVLAIVAGVVLGLAPQASARVAAAPNCQHGSGYGTVVDWDYVTTDAGAAIGTIQLCRDSNYNYWGFILSYYPLSASMWGDAILFRFRDGVQSTVGCDSPGGNGIVLPGQTRCWTPKLTGLSGAYTFRAEGSVTSSHTGTTYGFGYTAQTR